MVAVINTGGTFNKRYEPIKGEIRVPPNNMAVEAILSSANIEAQVIGAIHKDSLEFNDGDRIELLRILNLQSATDIIIVHGTDTMSVTASFLSKNIDDKRVVLTGAMTPFSINPIEATANFMSAYGFLQNSGESGVYIAMHGYVLSHEKIKKDTIAGVFKPVG